MDQNRDDESTYEEDSGDFCGCFSGLFGGGSSEDAPRANEPPYPMRTLNTAGVGSRPEDAPYANSGGDEDAPEQDEHPDSDEHDSMEDEGPNGDDEEETGEAEEGQSEEEEQADDEEEAGEAEDWEAIEQAGEAEEYFRGHDNDASEFGTENDMVNVDVIFLSFFDKTSSSPDAAEDHTNLLVCDPPIMLDEMHPKNNNPEVAAGSTYNDIVAKLKETERLLLGIPLELQPYSIEIAYGPNLYAHRLVSRLGWEQHVGAYDWKRQIISEMPENSIRILVVPAAYPRFETSLTRIGGFGVPDDGGNPAPLRFLTYRVLSNKIAEYSVAAERSRKAIESGSIPPPPEGRPLAQLGRFYFRERLAEGIVLHCFFKREGWEREFTEGSAEHKVLSSMHMDGVYTFIRVTQGHTKLIGHPGYMANPHFLTHDVPGPCIVVVGGFFNHRPSEGIRLDYNKPYMDRDLWAGFPVGKTSLMPGFLRIRPQYEHLYARRQLSEGFLHIGPSLNNKIETPLPPPEGWMNKRVGSAEHWSHKNYSKHPPMEIRSAHAHVAGNLTHVSQRNERSGLSRHPGGDVVAHAYTCPYRKDGLTMNEFREVIMNGTDFLGLPFERIEPHEVWANDGAGSIFQAFVDAEGTSTLLAKGGGVDYGVRQTFPLKWPKGYWNERIQKKNTSGEIKLKEERRVANAIVITPLTGLRIKRTW
ncbi:hypothetical protein GGX14DRAFT_578207 [Mycena pura]|uniref:Uncharacterized protein n=1 Tax=Mycena pura TaxID=153505 RepID=A0AAD6XZP4_9AGAR|nr:hypothetical protein GGX14DRAFT_578207 [Mycena pura]